MKILIADDEKQLCDALSVILKQNNYSVDCVYDGEDALCYSLSGVYDLIILDVMMPKLDGFSVLKQIRSKKMDTPVLILSAKNEINNKINGLNLGADDYLTKPFSFEELLARIKALLRRKEKFTGNVLSFGNTCLDRDTLEVYNGDKKISLGKKEFQVLEILLLAEGKNVDKEKLFEKIWGYDSDAEYNTIEVYISFIRKKLQAISSNLEVKSIRGIGYNIGIKND